MKQILILIGALLVTLGLHAETYTRVQCNVGNDIITLPVPSKYIIVGRDVAWATDYFHKIETVMKDPNKCNTIMLGMVSKEDYDSYQKGEKFYGFSSEVQYRNELANVLLTKSDFASILYLAEKEMHIIISDPEYNSAVNSDNEKGRSMKNLLTNFNKKDLVIVSKSDRHFTSTLRYPQAEVVAIISTIFVEGKLIYLISSAPDAEALAGVGEINKWTEEIIRTTAAESKRPISLKSSVDYKKLIGWIVTAIFLSIIWALVWLAKKLIKKIFNKKQGNDQ
jgi:hypothetical protein